MTIQYRLVCDLKNHEHNKWLYEADDYLYDRIDADPSKFKDCIRLRVEKQEISGWKRVAPVLMFFGELPADM